MKCVYINILYKHAIFVIINAEMMVANGDGESYVSGTELGSVNYRRHHSFRLFG